MTLTAALGARVSPGGREVFHNPCGYEIPSPTGKRLG